MTDSNIEPSVIVKLALVRAACREIDDLIVKNDPQKIKEFLNSLSAAIKV